jgi:hypothetical protein
MITGIERSDDHQVEVHRRVIAHVADRHAEERALGIIEDGDRLDAELAQRQVGQLRRLPAAVDGRCPSAARSRTTAWG